MTLNTRLCLFPLALLFAGFLQAQNEYTITADLKNVEKDKVKVVCSVPKVTQSEVVFVFPNLVPGSYALKEYGRYIENFKAYDANGKTLKTKKADKYNYTILNATTLSRVEYSVNDSWEEKNGSKFIFQPGGTNIEAGKNFVVNNMGFFGYVEGYKNLPYKLKFTKPESLIGYTYLKKKESATDVEDYTVKNYDELADNPILFCKANYSYFTVGNCKANVCVYSASGKMQAADIAAKLEKVGSAMEKFFGTLPVNEYYFLFYFDDPKNIPQRKGKGLGSGIGALEHNHCSFYYLMETDFESDLDRMLNEVCSHEFLHILTPLNLHSKEIADFNFRVPVMSKHLWMYEGVTEYFSNLAQLQDSILTLKKFWEEMRGKMRQSATFDEFSFTDMSKNVITPENQARYLSVYSRGALMAMVLDWTIIESTEGRMNLKKTMFKLAEIYGADRPFNDDELIGKFVEVTSPEVKVFFDRFVTGSDPLYFPDAFKKIGYRYKLGQQEKAYTFGRFGVKYDPDKQQFLFFGVEPNAFNVQNNDVLISINDTMVTTDNAQELVGTAFYENTDGSSLRMRIERGGVTQSLAGKPQQGTRTLKNYIAPLESPTEKQLSTFKHWLED